MSYQQKLSTPHGRAEFFHGFHANLNGKAPPIETPLVVQREPRISAQIVMPIGNHAMVQQ